MKKTNAKKLSLQKETLRAIADGDLKKIAGGAHKPSDVANGCTGNSGAGTHTHE